MSADSLEFEIDLNSISRPVTLTHAGCVANSIMCGKRRGLQFRGESNFRENALEGRQNYRIHMLLDSRNVTRHFT